MFLRFNEREHKSLQELSSQRNTLEALQAKLLKVLPRNASSSTAEVKETDLDNRMEEDSYDIGGALDDEEEEKENASPITAAQGFLNVVEEDSDYDEENDQPLSQEDDDPESIMEEGPPDNRMKEDSVGLSLDQVILQQAQTYNQNLYENIKIQYMQAERLIANRNKITNEIRHFFSRFISSGKSVEAKMTTSDIEALKTQMDTIPSSKPNTFVTASELDEQVTTIEELSKNINKLVERAEQSRGIVEKARHLLQQVAQKFSAAYRYVFNKSSSEEQRVVSIKNPAWCSLFEASKRNVPNPEAKADSKNKHGPPRHGGL